MKIDSFYGGMFPLTGGSSETTKANQVKPAVMPVQGDSFEIGQNFQPMSTSNTTAINASQHYNTAKSLSTEGSQSEITDGAWKDYLGAGLLVRDLRHSRWVTDLFQGFNFKGAQSIGKALTPAGTLPIAVPKAAAGAIADVATPAGKLAVATATKASPLMKIAAKAAPLAKVAARAGRVLGRAVPFINVGLAALDVHDAVKIAQDPKASTGKKVLGVATAALSVASVIPGVGLVAGLGASVLGIFRDRTK